MPINPLVARQARLEDALTQAGMSALALNPSPSLKYLSGLSFHLSERPVLALFSPGQPPVLVIPALEALKTANLPFQAQVFLYGEDPAEWQGVFSQAVQAARLNGRVGVEPNWLRFLEQRLIENSAAQFQLLSAEQIIAGLRMQKDPDELAAMRKAVDIAQTALENTLPQIHTGMSEGEIAAELTLQLLRSGSDPTMPFSPIVSAGPNSANPHASPSARRLAQGDLLVIDWGANYQGYCSDLTRTFTVGDVDDEYRRIAEIVLQANIAGREIARPGIAAGEVDQAARAVIEASGYGAYFTHRTGHGLGLEGHEPPYMRAGNAMILQPGMTFTVEPGIYLPERNGVRIEDNVVITDQGAETLSTLPRQLRPVG